MWKLLVLLACVALGLYVGLRLLGALPGEAARASQEVAARRATAVAIATAAPAPPLDAQVDAAGTAVAARQPFTVVITEAELNTRLARSGGGATIETTAGPMQLSNPYVRLEPGTAVLQTEARTAVSQSPVTAYVEITVADGQPRLTVREVDAGSVALPEPVRQRVQETAQAQLERAMGALPPRLERIEVQSGRLVVTGAG